METNKANVSLQDRNDRKTAQKQQMNARLRTKILKAVSELGPRKCDAIQYIQ